jgi:hypothetical protein
MDAPVYAYGANGRSDAQQVLVGLDA